MTWQSAFGMAHRHGKRFAMLLIQFFNSFPNLWVIWHMNHDMCCMATLMYVGLIFFPFMPTSYDADRRHHVGRRHNSVLAQIRHFLYA